MAYPKPQNSPIDRIKSRCLLLERDISLQLRLLGDIRVERARLAETNGYSAILVADERFFCELDSSLMNAHSSEGSSPLTRRWSNQIRTAGPILVFIDRGGRFETNTDGTRSSTSVHSPTIRLTTLGGQYRRHQYRLETLSALVLNDHAYDKLTGWSNVIPVVPVKVDATETYKFIKEESHGTRSTPHRHRT
jgi:hypothetical protein